MEKIDDCCVLAAVGRQMASRKGVAATMFSALAKANINIRRAPKLDLKWCQQFYAQQHYQIAQHSCCLLGGARLAQAARPPHPPPALDSCLCYVQSLQPAC